MNRLRGGNLQDMSKWYLAAAYYMAGQKGIADELTKGLNTNVRDYREMGNTYGSTLRDKAIILEMLTILDRREKAGDIIKEISKAMKTGYWLSTQEVAYSLMAVAKFGKWKKDELIQFEYQVNNGEWVKVSTKNPLYQVPIDLAKAGKGNVKVKSATQAPLYGCLVMRGVPPPGEETFENNELELQVVYKDMQGNEIEVDELEQGTDFVAEITVKNISEVHERLDELALNAMFPSGWQIYNSRMTGTQFEGRTSVPDYLDIRDDRAYYYFDLETYNDYYANTSEETDSEQEEGEGEGESYNDEDYDYRSYGNQRIFRIALNASFNGKFYLPQIFCAAMYDNAVYAGVTGKWIKIVDKQKAVAAK
jgi:uncharacterized protein YfaS (alpha-2-macroglobulin family)